MKDSQRPEELQAYLDTYPEGGIRGSWRVVGLDRLAGAPDDAETAPQSTAAVATAAHDDPSTPQPSAPTAEAVEASLGLERAERRQIQLGLASLGHDPGPADGLFGRDTQGAIGRWQTSLGGAATGHLDAEAAKLLLAAGKEAGSQTRRRRRRRGSGRRCGRAGYSGLPGVPGAGGGTGGFLHDGLAAVGGGPA